jgi:hypothetical protein
LCAPCFDPRTGNATGACSISADTPKEDPYIFPKCCGEDAGATLGTCVPQTAVSEALASFLTQETCPEATMLCAPNVKVANIDAKFPSCTTTMFCDSDGGGCWPGACIPACILPEELRMLPRTTCAEGEICAPCNNPLQDGASTGACD